MLLLLLLLLNEDDICTFKDSVSVSHKTKQNKQLVSDSVLCERADTFLTRNKPEKIAESHCYISLIVDR